MSCKTIDILHGGNAREAPADPAHVWRTPSEMPQVSDSAG
jgi:hypothetical protein